MSIFCYPITALRSLLQKSRSYKVKLDVKTPQRSSYRKLAADLAIDVNPDQDSAEFFAIHDAKEEVFIKETRKKLELIRAEIDMIEKPEEEEQDPDSKYEYYYDETISIVYGDDSYTESQEGEPLNYAFYENSYTDASSKFRTDSPLAKYPTTQLQLE
ncbi:unnamed protein product, partial [Mesorhabditis spiculigera]